MSTISTGVEAVATTRVVSSAGHGSVCKCLIAAGLGCAVTSMCKLSNLRWRMEAELLKKCQNSLVELKKLLKFFKESLSRLQKLFEKMSLMEDYIQRVLLLEIVDITSSSDFSMYLEYSNKRDRERNALFLKGKALLSEDMKDFREIRNAVMMSQMEFEKTKLWPGQSLRKLERVPSKLAKLMCNARSHVAELHKLVDCIESDVEKQRNFVDIYSKDNPTGTFGATSSSRTSEQAYRKKLKGKVVPKVVMVVIEEQLKKLKSSCLSGELEKTENYLRWLTCIPWGITTKDVLDVKKAQAILDEEHYGMVEVKDRIMEFIAIAVMRGEIPKGKVICLHGPPGVGKTSIAKCIAKALNRKYYRINVAGANDARLLKGHQICYIGSAPGRIVDCLKAVQTLNALVLIDEVDKIYRGISSTFLEVLDPSQNESFKDDYLNVPVDLSKMLFVCTANEVDEIPEPLKDRMEMILVKGYKNDEKIAIVEQYLIPKFIKEVGLTREKLSISPEAVKVLVEKYCPEKGVRSLERRLEKVARKATRKIVTEDLAQVKVDESNIEEFLGESEIEANKDIISRMYN